VSSISAIDAASCQAGSAACAARPGTIIGAIGGRNVPTTASVPSGLPSTVVERT